MSSSTALELSAQRWRLLPRLSAADCAYVAVLLLVLVGVSPFAVRDVPALGAATAPGTGDAFRQAAFASAFGLVVYVGLRVQAWRIAEAVPIALALLLGWCLLTALWSPDSAVAFRRATLASVVALSALFSLRAVGPERGLQLLRWVLGAVLLVNWLSILLVPQAVHLPGDAEPLLIGDWRGLYFHKNIAGSVSAIAALIFLFSAIARRRWLGLLWCMAAVGFLVMTRSKFAIGILPVAAAAGLVYRAAWRRPLDRHIAFVGAELVAIAAIALAASERATLIQMLDDPAEFTGRTEVWQSELSYIELHPLWGSGFGTFADTGDLSPLRDFMPSQWVGNAANGHDGYLELWVTTGGIGLMLALAAFLVAPAWVLYRGRIPTPHAPLLFSLFVFVILHNILESDFLQSDSPTWAVFVLVLGMLKLESMRDGGVASNPSAGSLF